MRRKEREWPDRIKTSDILVEDVDGGVTKKLSVGRDGDVSSSRYVTKYNIDNEHSITSQD